MDRRRFRPQRDSTPAGRGIANAKPKARPGRVGGEQPVTPGILQILQLWPRQLQSPSDIARFVLVALGHGPARDAAAGHQLLHLPIHELHDRCLSRRCPRGPELHRLRLLRQHVPATRRRPHHPVQRRGRPTPVSHAYGREVRPGRGHVLHRAGQEDSHRQPVRQDRGRRVLRHAGRHSGFLVRPAGLRVPDLLRFQRILRHGHRAGTDDGLHVREELRQPVPVRLDHRVLAPLAHLALDLAARLPLHPARREPSGHNAAPT